MSDSMRPSSRELSDFERGYQQGAADCAGSMAILDRLTSERDTTLAAQQTASARIVELEGALKEKETRVAELTAKANRMDEAYRVACDRALELEGALTAAEQARDAVIRVDLLDDLHSIFTAHGIASRVQTPLVSAVVIWGATACRPYRDRAESAEAERDRLRADLDRLVMSVTRKYAGQTRYETALLYIQQAEGATDAKAARAAPTTENG